MSSHPLDLFHVANASSFPGENILPDINFYRSSWTNKLTSLITFKRTTLQGSCLQQMDLYESIRAREPEQSDHSGLFREMGDSAEGEEAVIRVRNRTTHCGRNLAHWTTKRRCSVYVHRYSVFFRIKVPSHGAATVAVTRNVNNWIPL